jgi:hypothetical protein
LSLVVLLPDKASVSKSQRAHCNDDHYPSKDCLERSVVPFHHRILVSRTINDAHSDCRGYG